MITVWTDRLWLMSMVTLGCVPNTSGDGGTDPGSTGPDMTDTGMTAATTDPKPTADDTTTDASSATSTGIAPEESTGSEGTSTGLDDRGSTDTGSTSDSGSGSGSSESTSTEPPSAFVEQCIAFYTAYGDCDGYSYRYDQLLQYCNEFEDYYSPQCSSVTTDLFACLAELECKELAEWDLSVSCNAKYVAGYEACPEIYSFCSAGGGGGAGECTLEATGCIDGNTYGATCEDTSCTCQLNGEDGESFDVKSADVCFDKDFGQVLVDNCGFPEGVAGVFF